jgi:hypothetical protein
MYLSKLLFNLVEGKVSGPKAGDMLETLVRDTGVEPLLKSWIVLSNHDRARLKSAVPRFEDRAFLLALMTTLPGAPLVYYGEEIGMTGTEDPEQRGPMDWELATRGTPESKLIRDLLRIRNERRALQVGDVLRIPTERLFAFTRHTASVRDTVVVVANPTDAPVTEVLAPRDPWLMDVSPLRDLLSDARTETSAGLMTVTVPPKTVRIFVPVIVDGPDYNRYKRVP